jgi:hypothetical protein
VRLKDILQKILESEKPIVLSDHKGDWSAGDLLESLSEPMLNRQAHFQPGLYIAEINNGGYLGSVLFKVKNCA